VIAGHDKLFAGQPRKPVPCRLEFLLGRGHRQIAGDRNDVGSGFGDVFQKQLGKTIGNRAEMQIGE
jgi:hypothetical protein